MLLCFRIPVLCQGREIDVKWRVSRGGGGKPRVAYSVGKGAGTMEWIESDEMSDKGFGLIMIGNRVGVLLGKGYGVVGTKRAMATEENVHDDSCAMSRCFIYVCTWNLLVGGMNELTQ